MASIPVSQLANAVAAKLTEYQKNTVDNLEKAVDKTAKETVKQIKANAQSEFGGSGAYAKSWASKKQSTSLATARRRVIYSKSPYYRLAHLLEDGHAKINGGRVAGRKHIAPAAENAEKMLIAEIKAGIKKG